MARNAKFNKLYLNYDEFNNSMIVDNYYLIDKLKIKIKNLRKNKWDAFKSDPTNNGNKFANEFNFIKMMYLRYDNNNNITKNSKYFIDELKYLKPKELSIINKLRTEYINLNNYKHYFFEFQSNLCDHCKCNETVNHFLFDCNKYHNQRKRLKNKLRKLNVRFKYEKNHNFIDWLFPHKWQLNLDKKRYYIIHNNNLKIRIEILRLICIFVIETKRFNGDYGE